MTHITMTSFLLLLVSLQLLGGVSCLRPHSLDVVDHLVKEFHLKCTVMVTDQMNNRNVLRGASKLKKW